MATTKRMRRHARSSSSIEPGSAKRQFLEHGMIFTGRDDVFPDAAAARSAWREHRSEIMAAWDQPGTRPWAFWKYDRRVENPPDEWHEQLPQLLDLGLIDDAEAVRIERGPIQDLQTDQPETFCSSFENGDGIGSMQIAPYLLSKLAARFHATARWHAWRQRPALAARYALRANTIWRVLRGSAA